MGVGPQRFNHGTTVHDLRNGRRRERLDIVQLQTQCEPRWCPRDHSSTNKVRHPN